MLIYLQSISSNKSNASLTGNIGYTVKKNDNQSFQAKNVLSVKQSFFLLYGENEGYKNQITESIVKEFGKTIIKYDADDIINNPDLIFTELNNLSLFENKKIIIVNRTTDKLFSIVENLLDTNYDDTKIIFNAGQLDKKSKIRTKFEKSKNLVCIPFYADDASTLNTCK